MFNYGMQPQPSTSWWQPLHGVPPQTSTSHSPLQGGFQQFNPVYAVNTEGRSNIDIETIKEHLKSSKRLHDAAKEYLSSKEFKNNGINIREIDYVARKYDVILWKLERKVKIVKQKNDYLFLSNRIGAAVDELSRVTSYKTVSKRYKVGERLLKSEHKKSQKYKNQLYRYDKIIKYTKDKSKCFTYLEEFHILDRLCTWKETLDDNCHCQVCALETLLKSAYKYAMKKNKDIPEGWKPKRQADVGWVMDFEMRHHEKISTFEEPNLCQFEPQPSNSGWTSPCNVPSDATNSHASRKRGSQSFQVYAVPTKRKRMEPETPTSGLQPPHGVPPQTSTSQTPLQRDYQPFNPVYAVPPMFNYGMQPQPSTSWWQFPHGVPPQTSTSHSPLQRGSQQFNPVYAVPPMFNYGMQPQPSTSWWQPPHGVPPQTSTSHTPLQGGSQQFNPVYAVPSMFNYGMQPQPSTNWWQPQYGIPSHTSTSHPDEN